MNSYTHKPVTAEIMRINAASRNILSSINWQRENSREFENFWKGLRSMLCRLHEEVYLSKWMHTSDLRKVLFHVLSLQSEFHQWICLKITSKVVSTFLLGNIAIFRQGSDKSLVQSVWYTCHFSYFSHMCKVQWSPQLICEWQVASSNLFHPYNYFQKQ